MQGKVLPEQSAETAVYIGVDVCKAWLDVYLHPVSRRLRVANSREGLRRLRRVLMDYDIACVVLEATGKYHRSTNTLTFCTGSDSRTTFM